MGRLSPAGDRWPQGRFADLYARHRACLSARFSEDACQEAWLALFKRTAPLEPVLPWLLRVAARRDADLRRGEFRQLRTRHGSLRPGNLPQSCWGFPFAFDASVRALPPRVREAFELVHLRGLSQFRAGVILGVSQQTVSRYVNRATFALREELRETV